MGSGGDGGGWLRGGCREHRGFPSTVWIRRDLAVRAAALTGKAERLGRGGPGSELVKRREKKKSRSVPEYPESPQRGLKPQFLCRADRLLASKTLP